jgi:hypothetical protein
MYKLIVIQFITLGAIDNLWALTWRHDDAVAEIHQFRSSTRECLSKKSRGREYFPNGGCA